MSPTVPAAAKRPSDRLPAKKRPAKKAVPPVAAGALLAWRDGRQWLADPDELTARETDKLISLLGVSSQEEANSRGMSAMCIAAVLIAQRTEPGIPDGVWEVLRLKDITVPDADPSTASG